MQRGKLCPVSCRTGSCAETFASRPQSAGSSRASVRPAREPCSQVKHQHPHSLCLPHHHTHLTVPPPVHLECPSVRDLHMELDEVSQLLDVSKEQYDEILSIVQRHTDETVNWLSNMAAEFSWVGQAVSNSSAPENIFRITKVRHSEGIE